MGSEPADRPLEAALDELYGVEPAEFVATRTRLARALRDEGDDAAAKQLEGAKRPTRAAAALNLLARRRPEVVADLLARAADLRGAQAAALAGDARAQREVTRAHREALATTADAALALVERPGEAVRVEILATLQVATADEVVGELLRVGRLERAEEGATGFPTDLDGFVPPADELAARRSRRDDARRDGARRDGARREEAAQSTRAGAEARVAEERETARARAEAELASAEAALANAVAASEAAAVAVADAQARVASVLDELEGARDELRTAKDRAGVADRERTRLERDLARRRRG